MKTDRQKKTLRQNFFKIDDLVYEHFKFLTTSRTIKKITSASNSLEANVNLYITIFFHTCFIVMQYKVEKKYLNV